MIGEPLKGPSRGDPYEERTSTGYWLCMSFRRTRPDPVGEVLLVRTLPIRRILFPTDFSKHAEFAWSYSLAFAQRFGAETHMLHVIEPLPIQVEPSAAAYHPEKIVHARTARAKASMDRLAEAAKARGLICHCEVRVGVDFREILGYARGHEIDLIIMGTHGRTGLARSLLGSVAEKIVRAAVCPVLTVKRSRMKGQRLQPECQQEF